MACDQAAGTPRPGAPQDSSAASVVVGGCAAWPQNSHHPLQQQEEQQPQQSPVATTAAGPPHLGPQLRPAGTYTASQLSCSAAPRLAAGSGGATASQQPSDLPPPRLSERRPAQPTASTAAAAGAALAEQPRQERFTLQQVLEQPEVLQRRLWPHRAPAPGSPQPAGASSGSPGPSETTEYGGGRASPPPKRRRLAPDADMER